MTTDYSHITIPSRDDHEAFCDHCIAVEQARKGKLKLVVRPYGSTNWCDRAIYNTSDPFSPLDWRNHDYAIAPEPPKKVLVPWKLGPELLGKKIKQQNGPRCALLTDVDLMTEEIYGPGWMTPEFLSQNYVELLPDGTEGPCGTWEEQA